MPVSKTTWLNSNSKYLEELTIDGKTYRYRNKLTSVDDDTINMRELGMGFSTRQVEYSITPTVNDYSINLDPSKKQTVKGILTVYQRPYSVVHSLMLPNYEKYEGSVGKFDTGCETDATAASCRLDDSITKTFGYLTKRYVIDNFAKNNQKFSYSGEAFTVAPVPERGVFKYQINFGLDDRLIPQATSSGSITGFNSVGDITLGSSGPVYANVIEGTATESKNGSVGRFTLNFFGPNAEEVAGKGKINGTGGVDKHGNRLDTIFGFSGAR
nr:factor H binding protein domain-containing protein [uncultured Kingella sp.]